MNNPAITDLLEGLKRLPGINTIAINEIKQRYRRTALGPLWLSINMLAMVLGLSLLFGTIFNQKIHVYLSYIAIGILFWTYISSVITESCRCWIDNAEIIKQIKIPLSFFLYKLMIKNLIILAHNAVVIVLFLVLIGGYEPQFSVYGAAMFATGFVALFAIALVVAMLATRFRDVMPIIENGLQLGFYLTPIIWSPSQVESSVMLKEILNWNPFYYLLESLRGLIDGPQISVDQIYALLLGMLMFLMIAIYEFAKNYKKIVYWL